MPPRRADLVGHIGTEDARLHGGAVALQRVLDQPRLRARIFPKAHDAIDTGLARAALEAHKLRVVGVENRRAAALEPKKYFCLGIGDRLERAEEFEMHRFDRGNDRDMRTHEPGEWRDLPGVVHADLEHGIAGARRATGE